MEENQPVNIRKRGAPVKSLTVRTTRLIELPRKQNGPPRKTLPNAAVFTF